jgi:hypothetical protein
LRLQKPEGEEFFYGSSAEVPPVNPRSQSVFDPGWLEDPLARLNLTLQRAFTPPITPQEQKSAYEDAVMNHVAPIAAAKILNPTGVVSQRLQQWYPNLFKALDRAKQQVYTQEVPELFQSNIVGQFKPQTKENPVAYLQTVPFGAWREFRKYNKVSNDPFTTLAHEGTHGLAVEQNILQDFSGATSIAPVSRNPTSKYWFADYPGQIDQMTNILKQTDPAVFERFKTIRDFNWLGINESHQLIDLMARRQSREAAKAGRIPKELLEEFAPHLLTPVDPILRRGYRELEPVVKTFDVQHPFSESVTPRIIRNLKREYSEREDLPDLLEKLQSRDSLTPQFLRSLDWVYRAMLINTMPELNLKRQLRVGGGRYKTLDQYLRGPQ